MVLYSILAIAIGVLMFLYPTKTLNAICFRNKILNRIQKKESD